MLPDEWEGLRGKQLKSERRTTTPEKKRPKAEPLAPKERYMRYNFNIAWRAATPEKRG